MDELFMDFCEEQEDSPEVKEAVNGIVARLIGIVPDIEDVLTYIGYLYEKQGFRNGYGMRKAVGA